MEGQRLSDGATVLKHMIYLLCSSIDVGGGDHFGGADPDAAPLDDGEVLHHHQHHPHFYFPLYWF